MKIGKFEDIKAWQEARVMVKMVYDVVKSDRHFSSDHKFRGQIHNAAVLGMANIREHK